MQAVKLDKAFDNGEWISDEEEVKALDGKELPDLPGYHVLVRPVSIRQKTKGGIFLPDKTKDDIAYLTTIGKVLKLGKLAYNEKDKYPFGAWCKENDYVCYGKHSGQKFVYKGVRLLLLFDDQIIMRVENPKDLDPTYNLSN
jgi:co-chaperonin GroES (HSP10)